MLGLLRHLVRSGHSAAPLGHRLPVLAVAHCLKKYAKRNLRLIWLAFVAGFFISNLGIEPEDGLSAHDGITLRWRNQPRCSGYFSLRTCRTDVAPFRAVRREVGRPLYGSIRDPVPDYRPDIQGWKLARVNQVYVGNEKPGNVLVTHHGPTSVVIDSEALEGNPRAQLGFSLPLIMREVLSGSIGRTLCEPGGDTGYNRRYDTAIKGRPSRVRGVPSGGRLLFARSSDHGLARHIRLACVGALTALFAAAGGWLLFDRRWLLGGLCLLLAFGLGHYLCTAP